MSEFFHSGEKGTTGREVFEDSEARNLTGQSNISSTPAHLNIHSEGGNSNIGQNISGSGNEYSSSSSGFDNNNQSSTLGGLGGEGHHHGHHGHHHASDANFDDPRFAAERERHEHNDDCKNLGESHFHSGGGRGVGNAEFDGNAVAVEGGRSGNGLNLQREGGGNTSSNIGHNSATYGSNTEADRYLQNTPSHHTSGTNTSSTGTGIGSTHHNTGLGHSTGNANEGGLAGHLGTHNAQDRGKYDNVTNSYDNESSSGGGALNKIKEAVGGHKTAGAGGLAEGEELKRNDGATKNYGKPEEFHSYGGERDNNLVGANTGDVNRYSSNDTNTYNNASGGGAPYGEDIGDKKVTNQNATRHGNDFTGGFAATGGAYTNEHAKTGLTGRETTTTGVNDQSGTPTQTGGGGIMSKIKSVLGGHHSNETAANASTNPEGSRIATEGSTAAQSEIRGHNSTGL